MSLDIWSDVASRIGNGAEHEWPQLEAPADPEHCTESDDLVAAPSCGTFVDAVSRANPEQAQEPNERWFSCPFLATRREFLSV